MYSFPATGAFVTCHRCRAGICFREKIAATFYEPKGHLLFTMESPA
jgi:hypothetical protein